MKLVAAVGIAALIFGASAAFVGCSVDELPASKATGGNSGSGGALTGGGSNDGVGGLLIAGEGGGGVAGTLTAGAAGRMVEAGSGGIAGSAGAPANCVPEVCNGRDDNCDGKADEGCPTEGTQVTWNTPNIFTEYVGLRVGSPTDHPEQNLDVHPTCPPNNVARGMVINHAQGVDGFRVLCGTLKVAADKTAPIWSYPLTLEPGQDAPEYAGWRNNDDDKTLECPVGEALVGVYAFDDRRHDLCNRACDIHCNTVYGIQIQCAAFRLEGSAGQFALSRDSPAPMEGRAGTGRPGQIIEHMHELTCPVDSLAVSFFTHGAAYPTVCDNTAITGMRIECARGNFQLNPG